MPSGTPAAVMLKFAHDFGVAKGGQVGYKATISRGKQIDNYLYWRLDGQLSGVEAKIPKAALNGLLATVVENLNDNWSVHLLDKGMAWPNHRALPIRDGKAYAELDLSDHDVDLFLGHPLAADNKDLRLEVAWEAKGLWYVEAHNPTDKPIQAKLTTSAGWTPFALAQQVDLPPGTSKVWHVQEKPPK
jgi:hypothetical protein